MKAFRRDTLLFRLALSVSALWIVFIAISATIHFRKVNYFDYVSSEGCGGGEIWDTDFECVRQATATAEREYAEARQEVVLDALMLGLLPAVSLIMLAGFARSIEQSARRLSGAYWRWLRTGKARDDREKLDNLK